MQQEIKASISTRGLDIGTSRIVVAESNGGHCHYKADLNAFVSLPASRFTEAGLHKEGIPYKIAGPEILVFGERADRLAQVFCGELRRPMQKGLLNPLENQNLAVIEEMVTTLCGKPKEGEKLCFSVPCPTPGAESSLTYHQNVLGDMLEQLGFRARPVNEGLAVVLAELDTANYTGIGISFGGGMCNVCLAYVGVPVLSFSTTKAGDYIDRSVARVTGETVGAIRSFKEGSFALNGRGANNIEQALSIYYDEMIQTVASGLERAFSDGRQVPRIDQPIPVVVGGGSAQLPGFILRLEKALAQAKLPVAISSVRLAADPLNTTAKGALLAAILDA